MQGDARVAADLGDLAGAGIGPDPDGEVGLRREVVHRAGLRMAVLAKRDEGAIGGAGDELAGGALDDGSIRRPLRHDRAGRDQDATWFNFSGRNGAALFYDRKLTQQFGGYLQGQYWFTNQWYMTAIWSFNRNFGFSQSRNAVLAANRKAAAD